MITLPDRKNYFKESFTAYLAPSQHAEGLVNGTDYLQYAKIDAASFPSDVVFDHAWPATPDYLVRSFNHIAYGDLRGTMPPKPIKARRVSEIKELVAPFEMTLEGYVEGFGVILDLFVTRAANDFSTTVAEIMAHLHAPKSVRNWLNDGKKVATYVDNAGVTWSVVQMPGIINFVADAHVLAGVFDIRDTLAFLTDEKLISGQEFYNGHGFGVEPKNFAGRVTLSTPSVTYA